MFEIEMAGRPCLVLSVRIVYPSFDSCLNGVQTINWVQWAALRFLILHGPMDQR